MVSTASHRHESPPLDALRHTAAHVLAYAVQDLFPEAKPTIGPAIENGFYYDFDRAEPFTPDDLVRLEARMKEIVSKAKLVLVREALSANHLKDLGVDGGNVVVAPSVNSKAVGSGCGSAATAWVKACPERWLLWSIAP